MSHFEFEKQFSEALITPHSPDQRMRFAIYRNNVFVGLVEALRARYPAITMALGVEFFNALARDYAARHRPQTPLMMDYGNQLPEFLAEYDTLRDYPWLVDVARIEKLKTEIYHARDQLSLSRKHFASLSFDSLALLRINFIDACAIVISDYPLVTLWQMNSGQITPSPISHLLPEAALLYRDGFDVMVRALSHKDAIFINELRSGKNLCEAINIAANSNENFDPGTALNLIIDVNLVNSFDISPAETLPDVDHH